MTAGAGHHVLLLNREVTGPQLGRGSAQAEQEIKLILQKYLSPIPTSDYRTLYSEPGPRWARQS